MTVVLAFDCAVSGLGVAVVQRGATLAARREEGREQAARLLPAIAAGLALLWNVGSLIGMATPPTGDRIADIIVSASFSVLSLLPAVLLHISLRSRPPILWISGYMVSAVAVGLHGAFVILGSAFLALAAMDLALRRFAPASA